MQISYSDVLSATQNLSEPRVVASALLDALAHEAADCEHGVSFFAGPCALQLPLSLAHFGTQTEDIRGHAQAYAGTEVAWNRWSVSPQDQNQFRQIAWRDHTPLGALFRTRKVKEYHRAVVCIGDQAVALVSTCLLERSRTPDWSRLVAIIDATLPALRFTALSLGGPTRPANDVIAYLSPAGAVLAQSTPSAKARHHEDVEDVAQELRTRDGDWSRVDRGRLELVPCADFQVPGATVLQLRERNAASIPLSARDTELVAWLARGLTNKEIADVLVTRPITIKRALERLYARTGAGSRTELLHLLRCA